MTQGPVFLVGAMDVLGQHPDFLIPIYSTSVGGNLLYFQQINAANQIVSLLPLRSGGIDVNLKQTGHTRSIGEPELVCFAFNNHDIHVGSPDLFALGLHDLPNDERLNDYPVIRAFLAEYCRNSGALSEALSQAFDEFSKVSEESARVFRDNLSLTRVCRNALARAAGLLSQPAERYDSLRRVIVRVEEDRVITEVDSAELTQIRHANGLDAAIQAALLPYIEAFNAPTAFEFHYADYQPERRSSFESPEMLDTIRLFAAGRAVQEKIGVLDRLSSNETALPNDVAEFTSRFPYRGKFDAPPTNIIFFNPSDQEPLLETLETLGTGSRNIGAMLVEQLADLSDIERLESLQVHLDGIALVNHGPVRRFERISTPTMSKTITQFLRVFGQVLLDRPAQAPAASFIFSQAYLSGGIRHLEESITHAISSAAGTVFPLSETDGVHLVVTSVAKLTSAHTWEAQSTVTRHLPVSDDAITVRGWRISADPYSNAGTVAFAAEIPQRSLRKPSLLAHELDLVLKTCGRFIEYYPYELEGVIRVVSPRGEFFVTGNLDAVSASTPRPIVCAVNFATDWSRLIGRHPEVFVVPLNVLNLVLINEEPMRVARFIDFHVRRHPAEWIFEEASELLRTEADDVPFFDRVNNERLGVLHLANSSFSFSKPSARRNFEIGVRGTGIGRLQSDMSEKPARDVELKFTIVLRPVAGSRVSRLDISR